MVCDWVKLFKQDIGERLNFSNVKKWRNEIWKMLEHKLEMTGKGEKGANMSRKIKSSRGRWVTRRQINGRGSLQTGKSSLSCWRPSINQED